MSFTSLPDKNRRFGLSAQQITQIFGCHSPAYLPGCVKTLYFFPVLLTGSGSYKPKYIFFDIIA